MFPSEAICQTQFQDIIATSKKKQHDDQQKLSTNQINRILSSHDNPNANIPDMTAEQLSRHLAQSTDRGNFCAGEPPVSTWSFQHGNDRYFTST